MSLKLIQVHFLFPFFLFSFFTFIIHFIFIIPFSSLSLHLSLILFLLFLFLQKDDTNHPSEGVLVARLGQVEKLELKEDLEQVLFPSLPPSSLFFFNF